MKIEPINYGKDGIYKGFLAVPKAGGKRPAVIVAHAWRGQDDFARNKAKELADLGFVGFAVDMYGDGIEAKTDHQAAELMKPLFVDRKEVRGRILAAYDALKEHPSVDPRKIAAIGFCFGGLVVLELLRSGVELAGVVSFHGVLGNHLGGFKAHTEPLNHPLKGALLLLHGYHDPLVSNEDLTAIQKEFTDAGVDWQLNIYGNAAHAFSNPEAADQEHGLVYHPATCKRAWLAMNNFLSEQFKIEVS